jgi:TatD DNase family protein
MLATEKGTALVPDIPLERLLTETDGPFTKTGRRPARPGDIVMLVDRLAAVRSVPAGELAANIISNLRTLLRAADHGKTGPWA